MHFKIKNGILVFDGTAAQLREFFAPATDVQIKESLGLPNQVATKQGTSDSLDDVWEKAVRPWIDRYVSDTTGEVFGTSKQIVLEYLNGTETKPSILDRLLIACVAPGLEQLAKLSGKTEEETIAAFSHLGYEQGVALIQPLANVAAATSLTDEAAAAIDTIQAAFPEFQIDPALITPPVVDAAAIQAALEENQAATADGVPAEEIKAEETAEPADDADATPAADVPPAETTDLPTDESTGEVTNSLVVTVEQPSAPAQIAPSSVLGLVQATSTTLAGVVQMHQAMGTVLKGVADTQDALQAVLKPTDTQPALEEVVSQ